MTGEQTVDREQTGDPQPAASGGDGGAGCAMKEDGNGERRGRWMGIKGWLFVCAIALSFLLYGLFMYYAIGDQGPPDWNFGTVEDIPGESIYSTNESVTGGTAAPEPQHVSQKPLKADINAGREPHE